MSLVASARRLIRPLIIRITGAARMKPRCTMFTTTFLPETPIQSSTTSGGRSSAPRGRCCTFNPEIVHVLASGTAQCLSPSAVRLGAALIGARACFALGISHESLFHQAVFAKFLTFVWRGRVWRSRGLGIHLDVPALIHPEILGKFHHLVVAVLQGRAARRALVAL